MAITQNTYTGDGSTTAFSFTFPYLETTDIKVTLDAVDTTAYSLSNATTVSFTTAPASGVAIRIFRNTSTDNLKAVFYPGSAIRSSDLNNNFTQNLYVTQETDFDVITANTTADSAKTLANSAVATANTASTNASAAVSTANTADTNASAAVSTANTASTNASSALAASASAVNTANTANTNSTAAVASANAAVATANAADANATTALNNSREPDGTGGFNSAIDKSNTALTTANSATATATSAVSTANNASTTAANALNTANAAANSVAAAAFYAPIASLANLPSSPANEDRVEVSNSTGVETNNAVSGVPSGFAGATDLTVRLQYNSSSTKWVFQNYFASDPDGRYLTNYNPVVQGDGTNSGQVGKLTLNCSNNNHGVAIQSPPHSAGATYTLTLPTSLPALLGQSLTSDLSGNLSFTTIDTGFLTTPQTIAVSKTLDANINAAMMGPTVAIASGTNISVGQNSTLFILK